MIINAEVFQLEEDYDNNLWRIDFRDEKQNLRGKIEIPSKILDMKDRKNFQIEILPNVSDKPTFKDELIAFNAINIRTKSVGKDRVYTFSAGGLMTRLFTSKVIKQFKLPLKEFSITVR
ncbi:MAG: hypothetical protein ACTSQH_08080 [Candidatus Hodarchaeales archaeon]